ncbi:MAG: hypothetical protein IJ169_05465 [Paludibacteraceae bacterium]|nr:hypothetical protein [Paludibacteraceae bacterium]
MKANKFMAIAMMAGALVMASCNNNPNPDGPDIKSTTPEVAATEGAVTVVWNIANIDEMCDVQYVFAGNYNNWSTNPDEMVKFEAIPDYKGWYKAVIKPTDEALADGWDHLEGKPNALAKDGTFPAGWDYQWIGLENKPCELLKGSAEFKTEYEVETSIVCNADADVIFVKSYGFKTNPCVDAVYDNVTFNLTVTVPVTEGGTVYIVGDAFEKSWDNTAYPMTGSGSNWTITLPTVVGKSYKFCVDANWANDQMNAPEEGKDCVKKADNMTVDFTTMNPTVYGFLNFGITADQVCADEEEPGEEPTAVDVKAGDELVVNVKLGEGLDLGENKLYVWSWGQEKKDTPLEMTLAEGVYSYKFVVAEGDVAGWKDSGMLFVATVLGEEGAMNWDGKLGQTGDIKPIQAGTWTINSDWSLTKE